MYITCVQFHNKMNSCVRLKNRKRTWMTKILSPIWSSPPPFPPEGECLNFLSIIALLYGFTIWVFNCKQHNVYFSLFWPLYNCNHIERIFLRLTLFLIMFLRFICFETWIVFHSFLHPLLWALWYPIIWAHEFNFPAIDGPLGYFLLFFVCFCFVLFFAVSNPLLHMNRVSLRFR